MKKFIFIILIFFQVGLRGVFAQPPNDDCVNAVNLSINGALDCAEAAANAISQAGECLVAWAGASNATMWYSFDATNDSLVINLVETTAAGAFLKIYGPFPPGGGCVPGCPAPVYSAQLAGDPGYHILLTGLSIPPANNHYLVQVDAADPNGPGTTALEFCINMNTPASNSGASSANLIDACGTAFNETTNGGYWQNGTSAGFNNLDNNAATTCGGCTAGDDTPFIINNISWTTFCSLTAGTWQITVNGVGGCTLSAPNQGVQASVFTGTSGALVNQGNSANPIPPGGSYTSPVITVNAGSCAFLMIDGFAGDACNYSVTLTNITGGCIILATEFNGFNAYRKDESVKLSWETLSESNNEFFTIERSFDGVNFVKITEMPGIGDHNYAYTYNFEDNYVRGQQVYYRLSETDRDGKTEILAMKHLVGTDVIDPNYFFVYPNPSTNSFNIEFSNPLQETTAAIEIYDLSGKLFIRREMLVMNGMNNIEIITTDLPEGNYIIKAITPTNVFVEKIVKSLN